ncbi:hypothetical protein NEUTE1DRAFT_103073 [Neurospora tetrasperma FGSC 2508]|uniref:Uncharacterized protein n=1 Tax=Neurospora tetrasperma (strain FGSC 2508 / ATCC MYA-4615 / P0657) TaxID=510951 RepID=F8MUI2_NEUT8|nr:uncharacterized protein NEUTE1DRAFT_103073 [Neurospora tetrasperma FGSC 2508]EGO55664.1 hypothetical protein NEUTE1DRAFT_103073 [Neurospora tetrasperma FGSC 2508]EGZ69088.1 hypothetical protein NEUTE2DRAFT_131500 [Neurospora tetrasperma FGSC 2509]
MSDNSNTHSLPLYALGSYGSSRASHQTPLQRGFISVRLHRPYRDTRIFRIPRPESFEELQVMACEKCGVLARPRELVFYVKHRTQLGSGQYGSLNWVRLEAWNWGRFRDSLSNSATTPTLKIIWQPSQATLRDLRDTAGYSDDGEDESSDFDSYT